MAQKGPLIIDPSLAGRNQDGAAAAEPARPEAKQEAIALLAPPPAGPRQPATTGNEATENEPATAAPNGKRTTTTSPHARTATATGYS